MKNTIIKRIFSKFLGTTILTTTILAAYLPISSVPVYAAQSNKTTISGLCTGAIANPISGNTAGLTHWTGDYVYYGTYGGNAVKYRVLSKSTSDFGGNTMLLDCDSTIVNKSFDDDSNVWAVSKIKRWLNEDADGFYGKANVFTAQEKAAIAVSAKNGASGTDGQGWSGTLGFAKLENNEKIFLLDAVEATNTSYGYANTDSNSDIRKKSGKDTYWWLRSPNSDYGNRAGLVGHMGSVGDYYVNIDYGVSPAFNLNLLSIIFSSEISSANKEYKLTIKDPNMKIAKTDGTSVTIDGNTVTVPYTITGGAPTQVSVLITEDEYRAGTVPTTGYSYQKLNVETWGTSETGTFTLPDAYADQTWGTDYHVYILAETVNAGNATDYASVPVEITPKAAKPTFSPDPGTYSDAQSVEISCGTSGAEIYYTTDNSTPSKDNGTKYTSPITVNETTTIKAIAVKNGMTDSEIATAKYTISADPIKVTGVSLSQTEITLKPEATRKLTATVEPEDATDKDVTWKSDDESIAKVSDDGTVTAVDEGETYVTVETEDGHKTAKCKVIVKKDAPVVETCTITFDANGGKGDMDPQTVDKGTSTKLKKNKFTREGYAFDSWNTQADGKGKSYKDKDEITVEEDTTLYAQWKEGEPEPDDDDDDDDHHSDHTPPSWVLNPNEKQQLVIIFTGTPAGLTAGYQEQGEAAQGLFKKETPAGWQKAFSFNILKDAKADYSLKQGTLTLIIPTEYHKAGRQFALLAMGKNGQVIFLPDTDTDPKTITVALNIEGYAFELIYKD